MKIIGLTGGIASGKSTVSRMMREAGLDVHDADAEVHRLMAAGGGAVELVASAFGKEVVAEDGAIDRGRLGRIVFGDARSLRRLERILHPMVTAAREDCIARLEGQGARALVIDVPLLFETGGEGACDYVIVCACAESTQRERAMKRPGMTPGRFRAIVESQMPLARKRQRADAVIDTDASLDETRAMLSEVLRRVLGDEFELDGGNDARDRA